MLNSRSRLDKDLIKLQANIVRLGSMAEQAIEQASACLINQNYSLAEQIIQNDLELNTLRYDIEQQILQIIALQQPAASDLRNVLGALHISNELERIGDHAVGIAKILLKTKERGAFETLHQLPKMAKQAKKMLRLAIDAYVSQDEELARSLMKRDEKIDKGYNKLFSAIMEEDILNDDYVRRATYLIWVGHALERIGDRTVNIAERIIFMTTGEFVEAGTFDLDDYDFLELPTGSEMIP